ncbi:MAG: hypothetical protein ACTSQE_01245, partial [Candidatus Heimdallarchaeaceae archaeon]
YSRIKGISVEELQKEFRRFPYVILKGNAPLYKRSKHPSLVDSTEKIDKLHYINQALRPVRRIGVDVQLKDIKMSRTTISDYTIEDYII